MRTFNILEVVGIVSAILMIAFAICGSWFIVEYNKLGDKCNAAEAVIEEFIEDDTDYFLDVVCESDVWCNYSELK